MENMWQIIGRAPWWVYLLFVYLMGIGIQATRPRKLAVKKLILIPLFLVAWSFYGLYTKLQPGLFLLLVWWIVSLAIGIYLGARLVRRWQIHRDRQKGEITIPGNYSTLVLIFVIFVLKFFWGYFYATLSAIPYSIYLGDTITSAMATGFFVGRAALFLKRYNGGD